MNRKERRAQERIQNVKISDITMPPQMSVEMCKAAAQERMRLNYMQTQHPFHHLTANGVIVDTDPTLEYYLKQIEADPHSQTFITEFKENAEGLITHGDNVPPAKRVNRKYYGFDPFEKQ